MAHRVISSHRDLQELFKLLSSLQFPITVEWQKGRNRSLSQNNLQWVWSVEASQQRGDVLPDDVQKEWKLRYGVPILRENNPKFRQFYDENMKAWPYEKKIEAMGYMPVTRIMKVPEMKQYLDTIQRECAQQGIVLSDKPTD